jgi:hypothetical protein
MRPDDLDRILSAETSIAPASGFVTGVMEAVRREASAPPPIPFPWLRALPGLAAGALVLSSIVIAAMRATGGVVSAPATQAGFVHALMNVFDFAKIFDFVKTYGIDWIILAVLASVAGMALSMRLTTGSWVGYPRPS